MSEQPSIEDRATAMGWSPREQWRGDPERWVDADEFVQRSEHILPLVRAENKKLQGKVGELEGQIGTLQRTIQDGQAALEEFKKYHEEDAKRRVDQAVAKLKRDIVEARREGDIDAEVEAQAAITKLQTDVKAEVKKAPDAPPQKDFTNEPWFKDWMYENRDWYGPNQEMTAYAQGMAVFLNMNRKDLAGKDFLDEVKKLVQDKFPDKNSRQEAASKVEGGGRSSPRNGGGKTYGDLPKDAKEACDKYAERLVGPGKAYKTKGDWQKKYAEDYFANE